MKKKILLLVPLVLATILLFSGCESATVPQIPEPSKALSRMTDDELIQMADYYYQLAESSHRSPACAAYGMMANVVQNEIIIRSLNSKD